MSQQKILLLGGNGQVGYELIRQLIGCKKLWVVARDTSIFDNTDQLEWIALDLIHQDKLLALINELKPSIIINAAAFTAVDQAEKQSEICNQINQDLPHVLATVCKTINAKLIHFSTDYVFDGNQNVPYIETDSTGPLNQYGQSKLAGEQLIQQTECRHLIIRTSWVYSNRNSNFLLTILRLANEKKELKIVNNQFGTPTWSRMLAHFVALNSLRLEGLFHLSARGNTNWYEFAVKIIHYAKKLDLLATEPNVIPISSNEYNFVAHRPAYSVLDCNKFEQHTNISLPHWELSLFLCLQDMQASKVFLIGSK